MKRIFALVLVLVLVFALASTAFAATDDSGNIYPDNPNNDPTYNPAPANPAPTGPFVPFNPAPANPAPETPAEPEAPVPALPATGDASMTACFMTVAFAAIGCAIVAFKRAR